MSEEFIVIHAEWGRYWSGGTQQVALLLEGLWRRGVSGCLVCQEGSMLAERLSGKVPLKTFNLRGEHDLPTWRKFSKWLSVFRERQSSLNQSILVHAHSRKGALPTLLIARFQKVLTILHWRVAAPMRFLSRLADVVIANSNAAAEKVIKGGVKPERVFVVRSSIDTEFFKPPNSAKEQIRSHWGIDKSDFVVAGVGRLVKGKGYDLLLKSIAAIPPTERPILLLAGDGSERTSLEKLAADLGVSEKVRFLGFQNDVRSVYWAADVFAHVPTTFPEGTPNAILEAMAAGLPVIASKLGGIPEVIRNGETGLLVPAGDLDALTETLLKLRSDPSLRAAIGQAGQNYVRENHSIHSLIERTLQVYEKLLSRKGKSKHA